MPKGKGYTAKQIQAMRDEGVLSPSEIDAITSANSSKSSALRDKGVLSPSEIQAIEKRGYKYFPDNP